MFEIGVDNPLHLNYYGITKTKSTQAMLVKIGKCLG